MRPDAVPFACVAGLCGWFLFGAAGPTANASQQPKTARPQKLTAADVFQQYSGAVAVIEGSSTGTDLSLRGSGLLIGEGSILVTNAHVIAGMAQVTVRIGPVTLAGENVERRYVDTEGDLAVIWLRGDHEIATPSLRRNLPTVGSTVFAIGNPLGLDRTISEGIVSGLRQFEKLGLVIQHTAPISPGSSGGILFDDTGGVCGITVGSFTGGQNLNLAIPATSIRRALEQAIDPPTANRSAWAGFAARARTRFQGQYDAFTDEALVAEFSKRYPPFDTP